jgi:hypothetical protein
MNRTPQAPQTVVTVSLLAATLLVSDASAKSILAYRIAPSRDNPTLTASSVDPLISADLFTAGSGLTAASGNTYNWRNWDAADFAEAEQNNEFWTWGFDVIGTAPIELNTFDIRLDRSNSGPSVFAIDVSINEAAATRVLSDTNLSTSGTPYFGVDLSALPTLNQGDSVVFKLLAHSATSTSGTFDMEQLPSGGPGFRLDATVIPSPSAMMFGAIGLAFATCRRRRRA